MNDKDKEAFEKWWDEIRLRGQSTFGIVAVTWKAACEYKQKEIEELKNVTYWTIEQDGKVTRHISIAEIEKLKAELLEYKEAATSEAALVNELQAENAKLRECLKFTTSAAEYLYRPDVKLNKGMTPTFYFTLTYEGDLELMEKTKRARQVLKELEDK